MDEQNDAERHIEELIERLEARRAEQRDEELPRTAVLGGATPDSLRIGGVERPVEGGVRGWLERRFVGAGEPLALPRADWGDRLRVRFQGDRVRGVLPADARGVDTLELVRETWRVVRKLGVSLAIQDLFDVDHELYLTLVSTTVAAEVQPDDYVYGGFHLATSDVAPVDTEACMRVHRVVCRNGLLADTAPGRRLVLPARLGRDAVDPYTDWRKRLGEVIAQSFSGGCLDEETQRFRKTVSEMITSPYEFLCNLLAQGLIDEEEQARIQEAFDRNGEPSLYGLINAVTQIAHRLRDRNDWRRAADLERLGGEILRGDHQPHIGAPVFG